MEGLKRVSKSAPFFDESPHAGGLAFALIFVAFSAFLLSQLGAETKPSPGSQIFTRPSFWPAVGVIGMVSFGALHLVAQRNSRRGGAKEAFVWLQAFEFLLWFMAYVWIVPLIGYLVATLAFAATLAARVGYRTVRPLACAVVTGFCVVLIFKTFLSVKIPGGAIYDALPGGLRNFMTVNF